jgi:hypothetical protein
MQRGGSGRDPESEMWRAHSSFHDCFCLCKTRTDTKTRLNFSDDASLHNVIYAYTWFSLELECSGAGFPDVLTYNNDPASQKYTDNIHMVLECVS